MVTKKKINKDINYYLNLPWTYTVETAHERGQFFYIVRVNELPGVATDAATLPEAMELIKEVMVAAFELYMEDNEQIPEPEKQNYNKSRITYITTNKRQDQLLHEAQKRDLSLSEFLDSLVDKAFQN